MRDVIGIEAARVIESAITEATAGEGRWNVPRRRIAEAIAHPDTNITQSVQSYSLLDARWRVAAGNRDAVDSVREAIGAPIVLTHRPRDVMSDLDDLSVYMWREGIEAALLEDRWQLARGDLYQYLYRAARGILWNRMREEDQHRIRLQSLEDYKNSLVDMGQIRSRQRWEMLQDFDKSLWHTNQVPPQFRKLCAAIAALADDNGHVDWGELAQRFGTTEQRGDNYRRSVRRCYDRELQLLWRHLGGYIVRHRDKGDWDGDWEHFFRFASKRLRATPE